MNSFLSAIGFPVFWRALNQPATDEDIDDIKDSIVDNICRNQNKSILSTIPLSYSDEEEPELMRCESDDVIVYSSVPQIEEDDENYITPSSVYEIEEDECIPVVDEEEDRQIPQQIIKRTSSSKSEKIAFQNKMLIHSPRNKYVEFDKNRRKFLIKMFTTQGLETVGAAGIHSTIKLFQPISMSELCRINPKRIHDKSKNASVNTIKRVNMEWAEIIRSRDQVDLCSETEDCPNCTRIDNKKHGSIVDSEIQMFTLPPINYNIENMFKYVEGGVDSCTVRILLELKRRNWSIISPQHKIFDEELKIATAVDIICRDNKTGDLIIIELKTSKHTSDEYYRYYHRDHYYEMLRAPKSFPETGGRIPYSMKNDDLLQVLLTYVIIKERYCIVPDIAILIRLGGDKIWCYEMDEWCFEIMPTLRRDILLHQQNIKSLKKIHNLTRKQN